MLKNRVNLVAKAFVLYYTFDIKIYVKWKQRDIMVGIGFIGAGNMAFGIAGGIAKSGMKDAEIMVYDINKQQYEKFDTIGAKSADNMSELVEHSAYLFLCVKPQNFEAVMAELKKFDLKDKIIVTIAAGITIGYISSMLGEVKVVRVMPNTPLLLLAGASALCANFDTASKEFSYVRGIFNAAGTTVVLDESLMNAVVSVNGSSPAYVYLFIKSVVDGAKKLGIDEKTATELICATIDGSVKMVRESGQTTDGLIKMVSSPGGTTLKALETLYEYKFSEGIIAAMDACTCRADELSK
ncbi:MAG: pyrroline-5-carboxylate reductase [Bacillota bacterium]|nr:pyrroline-5-carboxylate reductase [Bacillota bacterium]